MENIDVRRKNVVKVSQKIKEGKRERVISFTGEVIKSRGIGDNKMITVRQNIDGVDVDRIMPIVHPSLVGVEVLQKKAKRK
jgi:large subunit ribosomal protein L19